MGLVESKLNEIKTEDHMRALSEREVGRINHEVRQLEALRVDLMEKLNIAQHHQISLN